MLAWSLPAWNGAGALSEVCLSQPTFITAVLEGLLTPVSDDGRVWAPEGRGSLSASTQPEFNGFVFVYCACLSNLLVIASLQCDHFYSFFFG